MSLETKHFLWHPLNNGSVIIDAWCTCGHKQSKHNHKALVKGHGPCEKCNCSQFMWKDYITIPNPKIKHG